MSTALRLYAPDELGRDGYPPEWHRGCLVQDGELIAPPAGTAIPPQFEIGIKHYVRDVAGNRCVRCLHPYAVERTTATREWTPCDERCTHYGPYRIRGSAEFPDGEDHTIVGEPLPAGVLVLPHLNQHVEAQWRILTVHHLDMVKANCRWWNLAALCQRCHLTIQGKVQMARVWPWEHTDWFKPYVAGYYAYTYLGEDLTREQTVARLEELLALERAA
jgi:5-methylcytosine-specific restriction endonuclease McrA